MKGKEPLAFGTPIAKMTFEAKTCIVSEGLNVTTQEHNHDLGLSESAAIAVPATGHNWGAPTYEWAADNSTVTATRVCVNDESHVETETVQTTQTEDGGVITYTATFENEAFETQTKTIEGPSFVRESLNLASEVGIVFYLRLPEIEGVSYDRVDFRLTGILPGEVTEESVAYSDAFINTSTGEKLYGFPCYVSSIQMADPITATLHYTVNGEERILTREPYALKAFFEKYDAVKDTVPTVQQNAIEATADYGHYAQLYLDKIRKEWSVADGDHAEMDKFYHTYTAEDVAAAKQEIEPYRMRVISQDIANLNNLTYSFKPTLEMASATALNIHLYPKAGFTGKFGVRVDGKEIADEEIIQESDGGYLIAIQGIKANELSEEYTIEITTEQDGTTKVGLSAFSWVLTQMNKSDADLVNMAVAIFKYGTYAEVMKPRT